MPMRRRVAIAAVLFAAAAAAGGGAWLALRDEPEWPPAWYVHARTNQEYVGLGERLRRRAAARKDASWPPSEPKLDLLRFYAVGSADEPADEDERLEDARVYFSNDFFAHTTIERITRLSGGRPVYVLALRGKFINEDHQRVARRIPLASNPKRMRRMLALLESIPATWPMVIYVFDARTMEIIESYRVGVRDLSPLGESIELDLDEEPG